MGGGGFGEEGRGEERRESLPLLSRRRGRIWKEYPPPRREGGLRWGYRCILPF